METSVHHRDTIRDDTKGHDSSVRADEYTMHDEHQPNPEPPLLKQTDGVYTIYLHIWVKRGSRYRIL